MSHPILVTGATGRQGGAVVDALLALKQSNITILAVTRDTKSAGAKKLAGRSSSIKLVQGNLDNVPALFQEVKRVHSEPVWGVYSVQVSLDQGATLESEVAQGKAVVDEAIRNGVRHFVYSSVERGGDEASWENPTPILHFQSKYRIERHLRDVTSPGKQGEKMGWTILRPVAFMDNIKPEFPTKVFMAALRNHLKADKANQWIAVHDIGVFAAKVFSDPHQWNHRAVGLAGDELTVEQMDTSFLNATGHTTPVTFWFMGSVLTYMVSELRLMIGWFATDGYRADIKARRQEYPELMTMEQWLVKKSAF